MAVRMIPGPCRACSANWTAKRGSWRRYYRHPDIAARLVISTGKKKGQHPSPATVMRMLREHDEKTAAASVVT
ncbi:MAG: hypothetical protein ACRDRJ_54470 [Streptosporangiaceae bacterium]